MPVPACREGELGSQNEPENWPGVLAQSVDDQVGSVNGPPSGSRRQSVNPNDAPLPEEKSLRALAAGGKLEGSGDAGLSLVGSRREIFTNEPIWPLLGVVGVLSHNFTFEANCSATAKPDWGWDVSEQPVTLARGDSAVIDG